MANEAEEDSNIQSRFILDILSALAYHTASFRSSFQKHVTRGF